MQQISSHFCSVELVLGAVCVCSVCPCVCAYFSDALLLGTGSISGHSTLSTPPSGPRLVHSCAAYDAQVAHRSSSGKKHARRHAVSIHLSSLSYLGYQLFYPRFL